MTKKKAAKAKAKAASKKGAKAEPRAKFRAPVEARTGKPPADTTQKEAIVARVTPAQTLKDLLSTLGGYKKNSDSIVSKIREEIAFAVDKKHLKKGPFALLRKIDNMEPQERSEYWHTIVRYLELTGLMAKIEAQGRLPLGDETAKVDGSDGEGADEGAEPAKVKAAGSKRKKNGGEAADDKPKMPPHPGIDPGAPAGDGGDADVSRPQFGAGSQTADGGEPQPEVVKH